MSACLAIVPELPVDEREAKYLPDAAHASALWALASQHLRPHHDAPAFAYARTTYYDTAALSYYRSTGRRLRVREYGTADRADAVPTITPRCWLELKQSSGGRRTKTRLALRADEVADELASFIDAPLTAQVSTSYRRRSLLDATGAVRLTLDDQLVLCRPRPIGSPFPVMTDDDVLGIGPAFVLELKATVSPPTWLAHALGALCEEIGFSKFVLGMDALVRCPDSSVPHLDRSVQCVVACTG